MKIGWDIRSRVLFVALVPTIVLGILLTTSLTFSRLSDQEDAMRTQGQALARQLASACEFGLASGNRELLQRLANSALSGSELQGVSVFDQNGHLLALAGMQAHGHQLHSGVSSIQVVGGRMLRIAEPVRQSGALGDSTYTLASSTRTDTPPLGEVVVLVSQEQLDRLKWRQVLTALGTLSIVLLGSIALSFYMSSSVSNPIWRIARAMTDIGKGKLDTRVPVEGHGSLRHLAEGVNEMAERLSIVRDSMAQRIEAATRQLRERTEDAERANLAKSRFLAAASHDLRQPMHALGLFIADLARKQHSDDSRLLIDRIAASAEAMENLLDSLLDISKLDAGVVTASQRAFPLAPLFERISNDYCQAAQERGLRFKVRPTRLWVHSDPLLFERILINLVSNALRYTPHGSVYVVARKRGDHVLIEVHDSGVGIPQDEQAAIFQEFVQLDNPARDRSKGLGLGLAIVRRLADLLCHPITLRSRIGAGSVFGVMLPLAQAESIQVEPALDAEQEFVGKIVAVIDDDALAQESLVGLLRAWGCFVVAADGPDELMLSLAEVEVEPDILVSDYRLPGNRNGLDIIAELRKRFGEELPALLLSGDTGPETLRSATDQGIPLLHKPVRPAKLRAALAHMLGRLGTPEA